MTTAVGVILAMGSPAIAAAPATPPGTPTVELQEIIVTAQRRAENLERTPVAVSVVSAQTLNDRAIVTESDLQSAVPGLLVRGTADSNQLNYAIRGQSVDAFSNSRPAVLPYVNEVQIDGGGSSAFYDLQSVQVLKGPQGTLFGRNATGGAVLFTTTRPSDTFGGYLTGRVGTYGTETLEGAVNLPIVDDKVLFRLAADYQHRDGFQTNVLNDTKVGTVEREGVRGSLILKPTSKLTNTTVAEYQHVGGSSTAAVIYSASAPGTANPYVPANVLYSPALDAAFGAPGAWAGYLAANPGVDPLGVVHFAGVQAARGPYEVALNGPLFHRANNVLLSNITTYDLTDTTQIKNIFGYTHFDTNDSSDIDGTPYDVEHTGPGGTTDRGHQISDELQLLGKALGNDLSYVGGLYYSNEKVFYRQPSIFLDLSPILAGTPATYVNQSVSESKAVYAQGTYNLGDVTHIHGLGVTLGARYTSETVSLQQLPGSSFYGLPDPPFQPLLSKTFDKLSWQAGLQEQIDSSLLVYGVARHSFRSGGFNNNAAPLAGTAASGGAAFDAEVTTDGELGVKFQKAVQGVPVRLNLAVYNQWITGVQRTIYGLLLGQTGGFTINVPKAEVTGVELDGDVSPARWLHVGGGTAYTDGRFTDGHTTLFGIPANYGPYPDSPRWSGSVYVEATRALTDKLSLSLRSDTFAESSFYFSSLNNTINPGSKLPGYALANFRLALEDETAGWTLAVQVKNAFDKVYYVGGDPVGSLFGFNTAVPGDRRVVFVEVGFKY
jgi:iron complex outermembrane receptor protein